MNFKEFRTTLIEEQTLDSLTYEMYLEALTGTQLNEAQTKIIKLADEFEKHTTLPKEKIISTLSTKEAFSFLKFFKFSIKEIQKGLKEAYKVIKSILKSVKNGVVVTLDWIEAHPVVVGLTTKILIYILMYLWLTGVIVPEILMWVNASKETLATAVNVAVVDSSVLTGGAVSGIPTTIAMGPRLLAVLLGKLGWFD
jgi:hypothetical protein